MYQHKYVRITQKEYIFALPGASPSPHSKAKAHTYFYLLHIEKKDKERKVRKVLWAGGGGGNFLS